MTVDTKITISLKRNDLLTPLQMVIGVVEKKQTLPILANVLIRIENNTLSVAGTDLEVELVGRSIIESSENCAFTVPGRKLVDICKALPDDAEVTLSIENNKAVIKSGRSRFTLSSLPAQDFPKMDAQDKQLDFSLPKTALLKLLQRTYFSMAQQDVRYYLNGILLEASNNVLRTVATDGHRLATQSITANIEESHRLQIIIPRKGVLELIRLLNTVETESSITIGTNHIKIATDTFTFTSKLVEGRFPDYRRVIPKNGNKTFSMDRDALKRSLQRTAILCNEKFHGIRFELSENLLKLSAHNPEQETAEEELNITYSGDILDVGFNVNYLIDILNTLDSGEVKLTFIDSSSSALIEHTEDDGALYVVMPMRL